MRVIEDRGEVDRRFDLDAGELVVVEEQLVSYRWKHEDNQPRVRRVEKRVRLTRGEREYLAWLAADRARRAS